MVTCAYVYYLLLTHSGVEQLNQAIHSAYTMQSNPSGMHPKLVDPVLDWESIRSHNLPYVGYRQRRRSFVSSQWPRSIAPSVWFTVQALSNFTTCSKSNILLHFLGSSISHLYWGRMCERRKLLPHPAWGRTSRRNCKQAGGRQLEKFPFCHSNSYDPGKKCWYER